MPESRVAGTTIVAARSEARVRKPARLDESSGGASSQGIHRTLEATKTPRAHWTAESALEGEVIRRPSAARSIEPATSPMRKRASMTEKEYAYDLRGRTSRRVHSTSEPRD